MSGPDLLHTLAIAGAMGIHAWVAGPAGAAVGGLERHGWMGVSLFFVLGGLLIGRQVLAPLARGERFSFGDRASAWRPAASRN